MPITHHFTRGPVDDRLLVVYPAASGHFATVPLQVPPGFEGCVVSQRRTMDHDLLPMLTRSPLPPV